jgi:DNA-binding IclR family transcriptional regulator
MSAERGTDYTNPAQQRVLAVLLLLAGNEFTGVLPSELARALDTSLPNMTRDLDNLRTAGLAERLDTGRWRLGPKLVQIALAFSTHVGRMSDQLTEIKQRYTRLPV